MIFHGRKVKDSGKRNKELEKYYLNEDAEELDEESEQFNEIQIDENVDDLEIERNGITKDDAEYTSDTSEEFDEFLDNYNNQKLEDPFDAVQEKDIPTGEETKRLSLMNIDWDNVNAIDLFVLFSSVSNNKVIKVEIYPSEYGIKEMEKEKIEGPDKSIFQVDPELKAEKTRKKLNENDDGVDENTNEKIIHNIEEVGEYEEEENTEGVNALELRKYELKKMKYYYAIVYCDTVKTASAIYNLCDGMEIERTGSFMDLRFVPDSLTEFPYPAKDICNKIPVDYKPNLKMNRAMQHSDVKLTWDSTDPKRNELISKAFSKDQFKEEEIRQLLMSSDSESDEDMKQFAESVLKSSAADDGNDGLSLLKKKRNKELNIKEGETIEIKFNKGFEGISNNIEGGKEKSKYKDYLENKKNKRREKKQEERKKREEKKNNKNNYGNGAKKSNDIATKKELNLLVDDSLRNKSIKLNKSDPRFEAVGKDSKFAIDPTSSEYRKNKK